MVVVEERGNPAGLRQSAMKEEEVLEREKEATKGMDEKALLPPLYIGGPKGGRRP